MYWSSNPSLCTGHQPHPYALVINPIPMRWSSTPSLCSMHWSSTTSLCTGNQTHLRLCTWSSTPIIIYALVINPNPYLCTGHQPGPHLIAGQCLSTPSPSKHGSMCYQPRPHLIPGQWSSTPSLSNCWSIVINPVPV